jgi:signal transduction histidine kinase
MIKDYGKGFHVSDQLNGKTACTGSGIKNIIKRAGIIGGAIQIESKINEGTLITIELPYDSKKD